MKEEPNPYQAPKSTDGPPLPAAAARSMVPASAGNLEIEIKLPIPPVCLKCGATSKIERREETFTWSVLKRRSFWLWYSLLGLLGGLGALLLNKDNDRTAKLELPLCKECNTRWTIARVLTQAGWTGVLLVLLLAQRWVDPGGTFILFIAALGATALMAYDLKKQSLQALYIDNEIIVLAGSKPVAVEKLAEARAEAKAKAKAKRRKTKPNPSLREPDAMEDRMGYEAENTRSLE